MTDKVWNWLGLHFALDDGMTALATHHYLPPSAAEVESHGFGTSGLFPLAHVPLPWSEVWLQLIEARLRFRSTLWSGERCVVLFQLCRSPSRQFALTERELHVVRRTLSGDSQKDIAVSLGLSSSTIGASMKAALLKLGFPSQRHTAPIAALIWSHAPGHPLSMEPAPVYSVGHSNESILAATNVANYDRLPTLTPSERGITQLLVQGKPNGEIAALRKTSPHTVENQVASLLRKAGARNRFDLLRTLYEPRLQSASRDDSRPLLASA